MPADISVIGRVGIGTVCSRSPGSFMPYGCWSEGVDFRHGSAIAGQESDGLDGGIETPAEFRAATLRRAENRNGDAG